METAETVAIALRKGILFDSNYSGDFGTFLELRNKACRHHANSLVYRALTYGDDSRAALGGQIPEQYMNIIISKEFGVDAHIVPSDKGIVEVRKRIRGVAFVSEEAKVVHIPKDKFKVYRAACFRASGKPENGIKELVRRMDNVLERPMESDGNIHLSISEIAMLAVLIRINTQASECIYGDIYQYVKVPDDKNATMKLRTKIKDIVETFAEFYRKGCYSLTGTEQFRKAREGVAFKFFNSLKIYSKLTAATLLMAAASLGFIALIGLWGAVYTWGHIGGRRGGCFWLRF